MIENRHMKACADNEARDCRRVKFGGNASQPLLGGNVGAEGFQGSLRADPEFGHPAPGFGQQFLIRQ